MCDLLSQKGRRVLITGGTRGIGRALSLRFARAGASVVANYARDAESAGGLEAEAASEGLTIELCRADITGKRGLEKLVEFLRSGGAELTTLIHCAATGVHRPLEELTTRHFDWTLALNARAFLELVRRLTPCFSAGASVLAVSSRGATRAEPCYTLVGASKGALESLARHMAAELAPRGIRVNILSPGSVKTDSWDVLPDGERRLAEAVARSPIGRLVSLDEVSAAALFLCSDAAAGIVGQTLRVDGGTSIIA